MKLAICILVLLTVAHATFGEERDRRTLDVLSKMIDGLSSLTGASGGGSNGTSSGGVPGMIVEVICSLVKACLGFIFGIFDKVGGLGGILGSPPGGDGNPLNFEGALFNGLKGLIPIPTGGNAISDLTNVFNGLLGNTTNGIGNAINDISTATGSVIGSLTKGLDGGAENPFASILNALTGGNPTGASNPFAIG